MPCVTFGSVKYFWSRLQRFHSLKNQKLFVYTRVHKTLLLTAARMNDVLPIHTSDILSQSPPNAQFLATIGGWDKPYAFHVKPRHACVNGGFSEVIRFKWSVFHLLGNDHERRESAQGPSAVRRQSQPL